MTRSEFSESTQRCTLDMRFARGGVWAGIEDLVGRAYRELRDRGAHAIIDRHAYELHFVLRAHRQAIPLAYASLTDTATGLEKTRNYPLDRAYRIVHGLVDFLLAWRREAGTETELVVVALCPDAAQHLAQRFLVELARRGPNAGIRVEHGTAAAAETLPPVDTSGAEAVIASGPAHLLDMDVIEAQHPSLIAYHLERGDEVAAARVALRALCLYNHLGFYHEAGSFADRVMAHLDTLAGDDQEARWNYVGNLFQGLVMTGRLDAARALVEDATAPRLTRPDLRAKMHYLMGMVHLRYAAQKDVDQAERHLLAARQAIALAQEMLGGADHAFYSVFIDNGLAFLRVRQGRPQEAIDLCTSGLELLSRALSEDAHRLHRSVLHYNTAQVHAMLGNLEEALRFYDLSIEMDPYYSEYHNESGNLLLRAGRLEEAIARYSEAVRYSAPYPEVFHNIGVCMARMGAFEQASAAFDRSLELDPNQVDVLLMRAEVLESLGASDRQLQDLDAALLLDPNRPEARVNRAVLLFDRQEYARALADMDRAIEMLPMEPDLYISRSEVHRAMGFEALVAQDIEAASHLRAA